MGILMGILMRMIEGSAGSKGADLASVDRDSLLKKKSQRLKHKQSTARVALASAVQVAPSRMAGAAICKAWSRAIRRPSTSRAATEDIQTAWGRVGAMLSAPPCA